MNKYLVNQLKRANFASFINYEQVKSIEQVQLW